MMLLLIGISPVPTDIGTGIVVVTIVDAIAIRVLPPPLVTGSM